MPLHLNTVKSSCCNPIPSHEAQPSRLTPFSKASPYLLKRAITGLGPEMSLSCWRLTSTCIITCRNSGVERSLAVRYTQNGHEEMRVVI